MRLPAPSRRPRVVVQQAHRAADTDEFGQRVDPARPPRSADSQDLVISARQILEADRKWRPPHGTMRSRNTTGVNPIVRHFYQAAGQVTRLVVAFFGDRRQTSSLVSSHGPSTSRGMCARTDSPSCIVKRITSRGPSLYARSVWHANVPGARYGPREASRTLRDSSRLPLIALTPSA